MIHSDFKASPKADNVNNAEKMAKPVAVESIVKADCIKNRLFYKGCLNITLITFFF